MDTLNIASLIQVLASFGPYGLVLLLWYFSTRDARRSRDEYKKDMTLVLNRYKDDMAEIRRMYENNVRLVDGYEGVAKDLKDLIVLNTQCLTRLSDEIRQNQYCPALRVDKKQITVGAEG